MKNLLKLIPFLLMLSLVAISCSKDEDDAQESNCTTDPTVTVQENIVGTWMIDEALDTGNDDKVTFNADGSGFSSEDSFHFSTSNEGKEYNNFNWAMEDDLTIVVTYDYSPDTPVTPFIISVDFTVALNNCDKVQLVSGFVGNIELTK